MLGIPSLRHPLTKLVDITLFSSEDVFPSFSVSVKKLTFSINDIDSKENVE